MTRFMYDAVNPSNIPADATMVAGYDDGSESEWPADAWDRWPNAVMVHITTTGNPETSIVGDVESGDLSPDSAVDWVIARRIRGLDPTVYCTASNLWTCRHAFDVRRVPQPHFWVADPERTLQLGGGIVALQHDYDGTFDISDVADFWPGVDTEAQPAPAPAPPTTGPDYPEENMQAHSAVVEMKGGFGYYQIPADEQAGQVVAVNVEAVTPEPGTGIVPVPTYRGLATDHSTLQFGPPVEGQLPDGNYGFEYWTV